MYIYNRNLLGSQFRSKEQPISRPAERNAYYPARIVSEFLGHGETNSGYLWAHEGLGQLTPEELSKKLKYLSFLPHFIERNGKDIPLKPDLMDPGIYDGPVKYRLAIGGTLQGCLERVFKDNKKFRHIKVALVDLTKDVMQPEFAGSFDHKEAVIAASVPKIAAMLAAYQLRHDLRVALKQKRAKTLAQLFGLVRADWADTQRDPGGTATPFTSGVSLRGKLVLVNGSKIALGEPKAPRLEDVFEGNPKAIKFKSTGQSKAELKTIINEFKQAFVDLSKSRKKLNEEEKQGNAIHVAEARRKHKERIEQFDREKAKVNALGFLERMRVMTGGLVPASNYATSTIVRDVGFLYIASTLLQSGLYDTDRKGGLWLGADFWSGAWRGPLGGEKSFVTATAGSLAAFMTLLMQNKLVSPQASARMRCLMQIEPVNPTHPTTISWFEDGVSHHGPLKPKKVLAKIGVANGFFHECAYIEREVECGKDRKWILPLRYVAVGLGAKSESELKQLIDELDVCILANNRTTPCVKASEHALRKIEACPF